MTPDPNDPLPPSLQWPQPLQPSPLVSAKICQECTHQLQRKRCISARLRFAATLALFSLSGILLLIWLGDKVEAPYLRSGIIGAAAWGTVSAILVFLGMFVPPGKRLAAPFRTAIVLLVPVFFMGYLLLTANSVLPFERFAEGASGAHAIKCGVFAFAVGGLISLGILLIWRKTDPFTPGLSGCLAGLVGGMGSAVGVGIVCPSHEAFHLGFSHGLIVLALVAVGWGIGKRWLAP